MSLPSIKQDKTYTYGDYTTWPDSERWEIINGIAYPMIFDMIPAPESRHQDILLELAHQFKGYLKNKTCKVYIAPFDVRMPKGDEKDEDIETVVQPDITVVCDRLKIEKNGYKGVPGLIIEVLSPSTAQKDLIEKLNLYEKAGVKEYWIVHPTDKTVMVFKIAENNKYGRPEIYSENSLIKVGIFESFTVNLKEVFEA